MRNLGLVVRRECWTLSLRGKFVVLVILAALAAGMAHEAYPFLALNDPIRAGVMIVEGWAAYPEVLPQVAAEYKRGYYDRLLILKDSHDAEMPDPADRLVRYGIARGAIESFIYLPVDRNRTYHAATVAHEWFIRNQPSGKSVDVVTIGPHARRTWTMYHAAFGKTAKIGVISLTDPLYDPKNWWHTSEGLRQVQDEALKYVYGELYLLWCYS